jgi:hypothetical protein
MAENPVQRLFPDLNAFFASCELPPSMKSPPTLACKRRSRL